MYNVAPPSSVLWHVDSMYNVAPPSSVLWHVDSIYSIAPPTSARPPGIFSFDRQNTKIY